jgi:hypothetical protein
MGLAGLVRAGVSRQRKRKPKEHGRLDGCLPGPFFFFMFEFLVRSRWWYKLATPSVRFPIAEGILHLTNSTLFFFLDLATVCFWRPLFFYYSCIELPFQGQIISQIQLFNVRVRHVGRSKMERRRDNESRTRAGCSSNIIKNTQRTTTRREVRARARPIVILLVECSKNA